jgi:hypothetical protein
MYKLVKNKWLDALMKTMLLYASVHMTLLILFSFVHMDFSYLNMFKVLDLQNIFPNILTMKYSFLLSQIMTISIFIGIFFLSQKKK